MDQSAGRYDAECRLSRKDAEAFRRGEFKSMREIAGKQRGKGEDRLGLV